MARLDEMTLIAANGLNDATEGDLWGLFIFVAVVVCGVVAILAWYIRSQFK
jgi:hypothetical protein